MGTKLQYFINPLAGGNSKKDTFSGNQFGVWEYFSNIEPNKQFQKRGGLDNFQGSMDSILEPHNIESIKKTILMHENTFKHQVRELHRIYNIQGVLMKELTKEMQQSRNQTSIASTSNSQNQHHPTGNNIQGHDARTDPNTREQRSGSCSGESLSQSLRRIPKGLDLERPAAEEEDISITGVRSLRAKQAEAGPSNTHAMDEEDCDLDLSLTIGSGCSNTGKERKQSPEQQQQHCNHNYKLKGVGVVCDQDQPNIAMSSSSSGMGFNQEKKQPHCLFQGLSLNRA